MRTEKKSGASPLSQYVVTLGQRAQQRYDSLMESSVLVGENASVFGNKIPESDEEDDMRNEQEATVFSSFWLPGSSSKAKEENKKKKKKTMEQQDELAFNEDVVEDLVLSSDEDGSMSDSPAASEDENAEPVHTKQQSKKQKPSVNPTRKNVQSHAKKSKKRKRSN